MVCEGTPPVRELVDHSLHGGDGRLLRPDFPKAKTREQHCFTHLGAGSVPYAGRLFRYLSDHASRSLLASAILSKSIISTALAQLDLPVFLVGRPSNAAYISN